MEPLVGPLRPIEEDRIAVELLFQDTRFSGSPEVKKTMAPLWRKHRADRFGTPCRVVNVDATGRTERRVKGKKPLNRTCYLGIVCSRLRGGGGKCVEHGVSIC